MQKLFIGMAAISVAVGLSAVPAGANTVQIDWFSVSPTFGDFNTLACGVQNCGQQFTNANPEVTVGSLSGGVPVVAAGNPASLVEGVGNPLQWWTPQTGVVHEGTTAPIFLPISQNFFVPEGTGTNDTTSFQTAIISALVHVGSGGGTITYGGDDDMFLALNGAVVDQVGGIHPQGVTDTFAVAAGDYTMEVFYADRHVVGASAMLSVNGDITTSIPPNLTAGIPEPSTWAMMILGFFGVGFMAYRRQNKMNFRIA